MLKALHILPQRVFCTKSTFLSFHYIIPSTTLTVFSNFTIYFNKNIQPQIKFSVANSLHTMGDNLITRHVYVIHMRL